MIKLYGLYDLINNELCHGIFTLKEIAEKYKVTVNSLYSMISIKQLLNGKYQITKIEFEEENN